MLWIYLSDLCVHVGCVESPLLLTKQKKNYLKKLWTMGSDLLKASGPQSVMKVTSNIKEINWDTVQIFLYWHALEDVAHIQMTCMCLNSKRCINLPSECGSFLPHVHYSVTWKPLDHSKALICSSCMIKLTKWVTLSGYVVLCPTGWC